MMFWVSQEGLRCNSKGPCKKDAGGGVALRQRSELKPQPGPRGQACPGPRALGPCQHLDFVPVILSLGCESPLLSL